MHDCHNLEKDTRNDYIDCLKGFLAISVVLRHCTINSVEPMLLLVGNICYSFHMFLFIFVSGWLVGDKIKDSQWIKKRIQRLVIPYVVWSITCGILNNDSINTIIFKTALDPYRWYLIVLFLCDCVVFICEFFWGYNKSKFILRGFIVYLCLNIIYLKRSMRDIETFKMLTIYFGFYFLGYCIKKYRIAFKKTVIVICMILYPISMLLYGFKDHTKQEMIVRLILSNIKILAFRADKIMSFLNPTGFVLYNHFVVAILGCVFYSQIVKILLMNKVLNKYLKICGLYTLQIYLLSGYFTISRFDYVYLNFGLSLLLGIIAPIIIGNIVHKFNFVDRVLFGAKKVPDNV